jgi:hypothetical protein
MTNPDPIPPLSDSFEELFRRVFGPPPSRAQSTRGKPRKTSPPQPADAPRGDDHE